MSQCYHLSDNVGQVVASNVHQSQCLKMSELIDLKLSEQQVNQTRRIFIN